MRALFNLLADLLLLVLLPFFGMAQDIWKTQTTPLQTRWAKDVNINNVLSEYPRPQMVRQNWTNLNGLWDYAITEQKMEKPSSYEGKILVPFPLESALSGVNRSLKADRKLWYHKLVNIKRKLKDKKYLLHFGAVDYLSAVYVNKQKMGGHSGGYQEFTLDVSSALKAGDNEIVVEVTDPTENGNNPRGKQSSQPQGIMYTASSGIWQTVWLEMVPEYYIQSIKLTPDIDQQVLHLYLEAGEGLNLEAKVWAAGSLVSSTKGSAGIGLQLPVKNQRLWSPADPFLYDLEINLIKNGKIVDSVRSYFGMRKIEIRKDAEGQERIFLNNIYTFNLGVLDQGFWPDGLYTAPTDEALKWDVEIIKKMGFNTIRKHIKIEPARWYYHCDKLGMLVWQDMVQPGNRTQEGKKEFEKECAENIKQLHNYPSIVCWVVFNEGWNQYDQERITQWVKKLDYSRLVDGHTGENYDKSSPVNPRKKWANSDMTDIHAYPGPGIAPYLPGKARVLGEWGGIRVNTPGHQWDAAKGWGYEESSSYQFAKKYLFMMKHLKVLEEEGLSASIYTQPFDVEIEENGLITYDRDYFKIPVDSIKLMNILIFNK